MSSESAESVITKEEANKDESQRVVIIQPHKAVMGAKTSMGVEEKGKEVK